MRYTQEVCCPYCIEQVEVEDQDDPFPCPLCGEMVITQWDGAYNPETGDDMDWIYLERATPIQD